MLDPLFPGLSPSCVPCPSSRGSSALRLFSSPRFPLSFVVFLSLRLPACFRCVSLVSQHPARCFDPLSFPAPAGFRCVSLVSWRSRACFRFISLRLPADLFGDTAASRLTRHPAGFLDSADVLFSPRTPRRGRSFRLPLGSPACFRFISLVSRLPALAFFSSLPRLSACLPGGAAASRLARRLAGFPVGSAASRLTGRPAGVVRSVSPLRLSRLLSFYLPRLAALPYAFVLRLVPASRFFLSALMGRCAPRVRWHACHYTTMISHRAQGVFSILFLRLFC